MSRRPGTALAIYRLMSPVVAAASRLAAPFSAKWRLGLRSRRDLDARIASAAATARGGVWLHAASVGEYEQAMPVVAGLRDAGVGPIVVTHFSPSGRVYAERRPCADVHEYLPLDTPRAMARLVAAWRPRCLVCIKYDGWPNQVLEAEAADVPVVLVAGSLPPDGGRLHPLARSFFRDLYDRFARIGVGAEADRRRFVEELGVRAPVIVSGDTRAEQVIIRFRESAAGPVASALAAWGERRLILGSTWPPDERLWLPVLGDLLRDRPDLRVVLAPHEPTPRRLAGLRADLDAAGIPHADLAALLDGGAPDARCVLVDRVGVLAESYHAGTLAYVGGSFTTGVHSTLEPAVGGLPVLFGPRIRNAEEALEMVDCGGGLIVRTPDEALAAAVTWCDDPAARETAGAAARAVVAAREGAAARSVDLVLDAMGERSG